MDIFSAFYDFLRRSRVFSGLPANLPAAGTKIGAVLRRNGFANITRLTELILKPNMDPNEVLAAMREEKPEFGKRDYIRVMREAEVIKQSAVRRFLSSSYFGRRRIASSLSESEMKEILKKFYKEYDFLYDSDVEGVHVAGTGDAIRLFDDLFDHSQKFKDFVRELVAVRGDFFSSDRELAALMFVLNDDYPDLLDSFERSVRSARESGIRWADTPNGGRMRPLRSDAESEQKLKEDLIRQGYTEAEAADIIARRKPEQ